tara:strand:+ start:120 stop:1322 length:1203 start_codon:yes stop_codon:yes gene_type:complete
MSTSSFSNLTLQPQDPIIGLTEAYKADSRTTKVNLGVGIYLDAEGKLPTLNCIKTVIHNEMFCSKGYLPIDGSADYCQEVKKLLFGHTNSLISENKLVTVQSLGGTGALRLGAEMLKILVPKSIVAISDPSWENHRSIFESVGLKVVTYPYYDKSKIKIKKLEFLDRLETLPEQSIVVLHACCHNPTGLDLENSQWSEIMSVMEKKKHIPFLDIAYQGFNKGIEEDAQIIKKFVNRIRPTFVASSFSKSLSLYGERVGALSIATDSNVDSKKVLSNLKKIVRSNYSNPPSYGQKLVTQVLTNKITRNQWDTELKMMRERIKNIRVSLVNLLNDNNLGRDFSFITSQNGMFSFTGLSENEVSKLQTDFGIYVVKSGRVCIAAINKSNIDYIASSINTVISQ